MHTQTEVTGLHGIIERYTISASSGASLISDIPHKKPIDGGTFRGAIRFWGNKHERIQS
jgi:hypothetical protein